MRTVTIVGMGGHLMDLEMPCGDVSCWDIMREIKRQTRIPRREQKLMWGDTAMAPRSEIQSGDEVTLTLVRVKAPCGNCGRRRRRRLLLGSACLNVASCGSACQWSDWSGHKKFCCKWESCLQLHSQCVCSINSSSFDESFPMAAAPIPGSYMLSAKLSCLFMAPDGALHSWDVPLDIPAARPTGTREEGEALRAADSTSQKKKRRSKKRRLKNKKRIQKKKRLQSKPGWKSTCPEHIPEKVFPAGLRDNGEWSWRCAVCKMEL